MQENADWKEYSLKEVIEILHALRVQATARAKKTGHLGDELMAATMADAIVHVAITCPRGVVIPKEGER